MRVWQKNIGAWGVLLLLALMAATSVADADEWHIAPDGKADAAGTEDAPWAIGVLADPPETIEPGDTVYLEGGTYRHPDRSVDSPGFSVRLSGEPDNPTHIRPRPGERVTIDGGIRVLEGSDYLWIWELEVVVDENFTQPRRIEEPGSHPDSLARPWGGLHVHGGAHTKFINLVIHHNAQGVSWWRGSTDSELHGCIIYANGWDAPDRGHGHAIYTQNEQGTKSITDNIMTGGYGSTMHAYGSSRAYVDHYAIERNIAYNGNRFLVGGGRPSRDITVTDNLLHAVDLQIGYNAPHNHDAVVTGNVVVGGNMTINDFREVDERDNLILDDADQAEHESIVRVLPNRYDRDRAHVVIWNFTGHDHREVDLSDVLKAGERYRLMNPTDFFGEPVHEGEYRGRPVRIPTPETFAAYVLLRER